MAHEHPSDLAVCRCGETAIALTGAPIQSVICYCESCRTAGRGFEREMGAPPTVNPDGGVSYRLYRKDRVKIVRGAAYLREYRLKPQSPTRRVVASCCASPMFTDFTPGHWVSLFQGRVAGGASEPPIGVMTKDKLEGVKLPNLIPAYATQPPRLVIKLLAAWAAMGFRRPKIAW